MGVAAHRHCVRQKPVMVSNSATRKELEKVERTLVGNELNMYRHKVQELDQLKSIKELDTPKALRSNETSTVAEKLEIAKTLVAGRMVYVQVGLLASDFRKRVKAANKNLKAISKKYDLPADELKGITRLVAPLVDGLKTNDWSDSVL